MFIARIDPMTRQTEYKTERQKGIIEIAILRKIKIFSLAFKV